MKEIIFKKDKGVFTAQVHAQLWLTEHGFSYGSTCREMPIAIKKGKYIISKWKNLTDLEKIDVDGILYAGRDIDARIILNGDAI